MEGRCGRAGASGWRLFPGPIPGVLGAPLCWGGGHGLASSRGSALGRRSWEETVGKEAEERGPVEGGTELCLQGEAALLRWEMKRQNLF